MSQDKSLIDIGRRNLTVQDNHPVRKLLPSYFAEEYPKFIKFLEAYYDYADSDVSPHHLINDLFLNRDITQTDLSLLSFIEDELLLGTQYFEGFDNKRAAAKYSNTLYKSKGTLYGIQQFFRTFFSISPEVVYTKENVFTVGQDEIGAESQRFITDDKLYQKYAILVKASIPISEWREEYKLFVHPAGMYLGGEVQIVSDLNLALNNMPLSIPEDESDPVVEGVAKPAFSGVLDITGLIGDSAGVDKYRINLDQVDDYQSYPLQELDRQYDTYIEFMSTNSPTFDEDSAVGDPRVPRFSNVFDTFDEVAYSYYDSDSA